MTSTPSSRSEERRHRWGRFAPFCKRLSAKEAVRAVLAPRHLPMKAMVMPALVARADQMDGVDPLAPCFPMNAARIASRLARKPMGAAVGGGAAALRDPGICGAGETQAGPHGRGDPDQRGLPGGLPEQGLHPVCRGGPPGRHAGVRAAHAWPARAFNRSWPRPAGRASSRCRPRAMFTSGFSAGMRGGL